ncbi:MAG: hypothetical protein ACR2PB_09975 [Desulfocapsaceae bacterium]
MIRNYTGEEQKVRGGNRSLEVFIPGYGYTAIVRIKQSVSVAYLQQVANLIHGGGLLIQPFVYKNLLQSMLNHGEVTKFEFYLEWHGNCFTEVETNAAMAVYNRRSVLRIIGSEADVQG